MKENLASGLRLELTIGNQNINKYILHKMGSAVLLLIVLLGIWIIVPRILILLQEKKEGCLFVLIFGFILFMIIVFVVSSLSSTGNISTFDPYDDARW